MKVAGEQLARAATEDRLAFLEEQRSHERIEKGHAHEAQPSGESVSEPRQHRWSRLPVLVLLLATPTACGEEPRLEPPTAQTVQAVQENSSFYGMDTKAGDTFGQSVAVDGDTMIVGAFHSDTVGADSGSAYVFRRSDHGWIQEGKLMSSTLAAEDKFGVAVAVSGDTAVVGAFQADNSAILSGAAFVFTRSGSTWTQQTELKPSPISEGAKFGLAVAVHGDTAVVGAPTASDGKVRSGTAFVFTRHGNDWIQQDQLRPNPSAADEYFGRAVAVRGDTAVVGAPQVDDNGMIHSGSGTAFVFTRSESRWTQQVQLTPPKLAAGDGFGAGVALDRDTAVIGAPRVHEHGIDSGAAFVFTGSGSTWTQQAKLTPPELAAGDLFGNDVTISEDALAVGARFTDTHGPDAGAAFVFGRSAGNWSQEARIAPNSLVENDLFGRSLSLSGETLAISAPNTNAKGAGSGIVHVFSLSEKASDPCAGPAGCASDAGAGSGCSDGSCDPHPTNFYSCAASPPLTRPSLLVALLGSLFALGLVRRRAAR